jgi:hypothetical protein
VAARALGASTAAVRCEREVIAAAQSRFEDTGAVLSLCAADAMVIGAPMLTAATVPVQRQ